MIHHPRLLAFNSAQDALATWGGGICWQSRAETQNLTQTLSEFCHSSALDGNLIGSDNTGKNDLGNKKEGVLIEGAYNNTIGGTTAAALNLISANHWGVRLYGKSAKDNLVEGNLIGTDITGKAPLGNEVNGVIEQQRILQHDRRDRIRRWQYDRLQCPHGSQSRVGHGRFDPHEQHLLQRTARN